MAQSFGVGVAAVACDPTLHAAAIDAQLLGDFADGTPLIDFQQCQNAPIEGGITSPR
jgi:hypothetical protein